MLTYLMNFALPPTSQSNLTIPKVSGKSDTPLAKTEIEGPFVCMHLRIAKLCNPFPLTTLTKTPGYAPSPLVTPLFSTTRVSCEAAGTVFPVGNRLRKSCANSVRRLRVMVDGGSGKPPVPPVIRSLHTSPPRSRSAMSVIPSRFRRFPRFHRHGYYYGLYPSFKTG
jgi:hypothetical protein